jgi:murein DD-endopeptidase MepM/ murein hydrolase activator NlpD
MNFPGVWKNWRRFLHQMRSIIYFCTAGFLLFGCERDRLSPVEIKIDEDAGYTAIGNIALEAVHIVSGGETLFDVANKYNVDPMNLADINGIRSPYTVRDGQALRLPTENFPSPAEQTEDEKPKKTEENPEEKLEKELDKEFAGVMSVKGKPVAAAAAVAAAVAAPASAAAGVAEPKKKDTVDQEKALSTPKKTQTALGTGLPQKSVKQSETVAIPAPNKMVYPVKGRIISGFGDVKDGVSNDGINIKAAQGTPVKASENGEVIYTGNKLEEFGNTVIIKHDNNVITSYAHLNDVNIKNGAVVHRGDVIGTVGKTGDVSEPQLHFEVLKNKVPANPLKYLD